jgi:hypothetical protein
LIERRRREEKKRHTLKDTVVVVVVADEVYHIFLNCKKHSLMKYLRI